MAKRRRKSVVKNVSPSSSPSLSSDPAEVTEEEEKQHKKIKIEDLPLSSSSPSIDSNTSSTVELISHDTHTPIDTSTSNFIQVFNSRDVAWKVWNYLDIHEIISIFSSLNQYFNSQLNPCRQPGAFAVQLHTVAMEHKECKSFQYFPIESSTISSSSSSPSSLPSSSSLTPSSSSSSATTSSYSIPSYLAQREHLDLCYLPVSNTMMFNLLSHFNPVRMTSLEIHIPGALSVHNSNGKPIPVYGEDSYTPLTKRWTAPRIYVLLYYFHHIQSLEIYGHHDYLDSRIKPSGSANRNYRFKSSDWFPSFPFLTRIHLEQAVNLLFPLIDVSPSLTILSMDNSGRRVNSYHRPGYYTIFNNNNFRTVPPLLRELTCHRDDLLQRGLDWVSSLASQLTNINIIGLLDGPLLQSIRPKQLTHLTLTELNVAKQSFTEWMKIISPTITHIHLIDSMISPTTPAQAFGVAAFHFFSTYGLFDTSGSSHRPSQTLDFTTTQPDFHFPHLHSLIITHPKSSSCQWPISATLYPQLHELTLHDISITIMTDTVSFPPLLESLSLSFSLESPHDLSNVKLTSIASLTHLTSLSLTSISPSPSLENNNDETNHIPSEQIRSILHNSSLIATLTLTYPSIIYGKSFTHLSSLPHLNTMTICFPPPFPHPAAQPVVRVVEEEEEKKMVEVSPPYEEIKNSSSSQSVSVQQEEKKEETTVVDQLIRELIQYFTPPSTLQHLILPASCTLRASQLIRGWEERQLLISPSLLSFSDSPA